MKTRALKKMKLQNSLNLLSGKKLDEVKKYVEYILEEEHVKKPVKRSLKGIWINTGFDKIVDLEKEIAKTRKELSASIIENIS